MSRVCSKCGGEVTHNVVGAWCSTCISKSSNKNYKKRNDETAEKRDKDAIRRKLIDLPISTIEIMGAGSKGMIEEMVIEKYGQ
ncbi:MAG: hypothetical protein GY781_15150 [Gammaproteobacteria bacterium]|nr:hypothetical protein [Gammaproteobacteria bacterium]